MTLVLFMAAEATRGSESSVAPSADAVRRRMQATKRRDTAPEMALRRELHRRGLRYRVDMPLPGIARRRADVLFSRKRVVVFVDGCFWHSCPQHATVARTNAQFWADKLARNVGRDRDTDERLQRNGWTVIRVWEHEDPVAAADRVQRALSDDSTGPTATHARAKTQEGRPLSLADRRPGRRRPV